MSDWAIRLPVRDREDTLVDVACSVRELPDPDDRAVARTIAIEAATDSGMRTAGELLDHLDAMSQPERRQLLDDAREAAGLERSEAVDDAERFEMLQAEAHRRAAKRPVPSCAVCGGPPTDAKGMPDLNVVRFVRKWYCREHLAQAQPGDMDPLPSPVDLNMRLLDPDEDARERRKDEARREQEERRRREREAETETIRRARERYEESVAEDDYVRPLIANIRGARMDTRR